MDKVTAAQVFITIVDLGSMSKAAEKLDMSRAMVTRYLAEMENWAGIRLLNRTTRKLSLTSAGGAVYSQSLKLIEVAQSIEQPQIIDEINLHGLVRISCAQSLAMSALSQAIPEFRQRFPHVAVDLQINNKTINLIEERIDLAIRISNNLDPNLIARPLSTCYSALCATPAYIAKQGLIENPNDLLRHDCLTYNFFGHSLWLFEKDNKPISVPVSGSLSANESTVLLAATLQDQGISMQPYCSVYELIKQGKLIHLLPEYQLETLGIYGVYTSRQNMPAPLRALLDFLVDWFQSSTYWSQFLLKSSR